MFFCCEVNPWSGFEVLRGFLLNAFFAEASALGRSLTGLELRVALADDVEGAFTFNDLAVFVALLHGEE